MAANAPEMFYGPQPLYHSDSTFKLDLMRDTIASSLCALRGHKLGIQITAQEEERAARFETPFCSSQEYYGGLRFRQGGPSAPLIEAERNMSQNKTEGTCRSLSAHFIILILTCQRVG